MNITTVNFAAGSRYATAETDLWQWDYGQILRIVGLDLPEAYAVHFSNDPTRGSSSTEIGGPDGVQIPDAYLQTGKPVYAFIFLHTGEDDGETEYKITIYVNARPQPDGETPTPEQQSVIDQLIAALNTGVAESEEAAEASAQSASDAAQSAQEAAESAASVEGVVEAAEAARDAAQAAQAASESAKDAAQAAQASAEASATSASGSAASAAGSATAAAGSASDASASATAAGASAAGASASATTASAAATAAQTAQQAAEQAAQQAHVEYEQLSDEVDDLADEVTQQKSAIDTKAGALVETASGAITSFVPDATIDHLLELDVNIEPVQDLHGFDAPWPGGGKVSKCPTFANGTHTLGNGVKITIQNGKITIDGTPTAAGYWEESIQPTVIPDDAYITFNNPVASQYVAIVFRSGSRNAAVTVPSLANRTQAILDTAIGQTIDALQISFNGQGTFSNFRLSPIVHIGSTPQPYSQYSNICPISGWDAVGIEAAGVNLLDVSTAEVGTAWNGSANPARARLVVPIKRNAQYILTMNGTNTLDGVFSLLSTTVPPATVGGRTFPYSFNSGENDYLVLGFNKTAISQSDLDALKLQLEPGSSASAYKPYAGNTYTIALGQTVYGGTLDVTNGTLTVDKGFLSFNGSSSNGWSYQTTYGSVSRFNYNNNDIKPSGAIASNYLPVGAIGTQNLECINTHGSQRQCMIQISTSRLSSNDVSGLMSYFSAHPLQICFDLATPVTIQLDPVTIATISGQTNNVWADAGDVSVEYAADIKAYIDRLNQPTEDDMIANSLIASGKYFTVNNRLFLSTASIAAGAQIIPGTNCVETSLAEALNALNA